MTIGNRHDAARDLAPRSTLEIALLFPPDSEAGALALTISLHTGSDDQAAHLAACLACSLDMEALETALADEQYEREAEAQR